MKGSLKIVTRCVAFFVIFSMIFSNTSDYLRRPDDESDEIHAFYDEPKESIDVLFMGSSPILRGVSPMVMWEQEGFTSYVRASALQPTSVTYGLLQESLEYQTPELVVLLCDNIFLEYDYVEREGDLRRALDGMKISKHKFQIVNEITAADDRQTLLSYMFPLFRYHERWKEVDWAEAEPTPLMEHSFKKGNVYLRGGEPLAFSDNFMEPSGIAAPALNQDARNDIEKSIRLCKEKNIPVLMIHLPKMSWSYEQSVALENFAKEMGVEYLDFDRGEIRSQLSLDPALDYYDQGHMNLIGSVKLSQWFGDYLDETYDLPDHRKDETYQRWHEDYQMYAERTKVE
ncbi:hypothetical protein [Anaerotignum sp. MB30-C6]|uniref:hypothetical protein n=1 Tax=Anaerotignum sp. MB30-C6 TaxID=3070814 RepID=UPI0027DC334B|nr:hypothetical protein [Anaerotignum sp. MB30-C6]WMI81889.1 hypothetical protein RBQ60_03940 [Anaerotignum sp. MB30-C6]